VRLRRQRQSTRTASHAVLRVLPRPTPLLRVLLQAAARRHRRRLRRSWAAVRSWLAGRLRVHVRSHARAPAHALLVAHRAPSFFLCAGLLAGLDGGGAAAVDGSVLIAAALQPSLSSAAKDTDSLRKQLALAVAARCALPGADAAFLTSRQPRDFGPLDPLLPLPLMDEVFGAAADFALTGAPDNVARDVALQLCQRFACTTAGEEVLLNGALCTLLRGAFDNSVESAIAGAALPDCRVLSHISIAGQHGASDDSVAVPLLLVENKVSGGSDPWFQNVAYYARLLPKVMDEAGRFRMNQELLHQHPRLPAFLLDFCPGGVLLLRGAAVTFPTISTEVLAVAHLATTPAAILSVARLIGAARNGIHALRLRYTSRPLSANVMVTPSVHDSATSLLGVPALTRRGYRISQELAPLVFLAQRPIVATATAADAASAAGGASPTEQPSAVVVKFVRGRYGSDAHAAVGGAGFAPRLLEELLLPGGWRAVVMEHLPRSVWRPLDVAQPGERAAALDTYARSFAAHGFVHGDLRPANVLIRHVPVDSAAPDSAGSDAGAGAAGRASKRARTADSVEVRFIDFDWAGRAGDASLRYPLLNPVLDAAYSIAGATSGAIITAEHDRRLLEHWPQNASV